MDWLFTVTKLRTGTTVSLGDHPLTKQPEDSGNEISPGNKEQVPFDGEIFLREKTEPTIFGIWPVGYSDMDHLEWNTKKDSILKNYLTLGLVYSVASKSG